MQILLIRHGESEADILNVHEGRADFELTEKGREQVQKTCTESESRFPARFHLGKYIKTCS